MSAGPFWQRTGNPRIFCDAENVLTLSATFLHSACSSNKQIESCGAGVRCFSETMKTKTLLWIGISVVILAVISVGVWWELRPQVINFDDGSKLTLVKVDYGKQHKPPQIRGVRTRGRSFNTTNDTLVLWVRQQYDSQDWHNFQYYIYDKDGVACVGSSGGYGGYSRQGNEIVGVQFSAFPRRGSRFYVRAQENGNGGQDMSDDKFIVSNPARGEFTAWVPQPLPDTEEDGDFSATLKKLVACAKMPFTRNGDDEDDPINKGVQATFQIQFNGTNTGDWQPVAVETSDATGNSVNGWLNSQPQGDDLVASYQYGLWPDEPAWKLRVEFSRQANFDNSELWKVSEIPLQPTRQQDFWNYGGRRRKQVPAFAETDLGGVHISLYPIKQFTNMPPNSQPQGGMIIEVQPPLPEGTRLTIVKLTDDQANDIQYWNYGEGSSAKSQSFHYGLQNLDGVTNVNLTLAVHQSHFVEFTVKPEVQTAAAETDQSNQQ